MTDTEKLQFLLSKLQETAKRKHCEDGDYYSPSESGSYDDAFDDGADYGEVVYARELLQQLNFQIQITPHLK
jgi:hypothetical protein